MKQEEETKSENWKALLSVPLPSEFVVFLQPLLEFPRDSSINLLSFVLNFFPQTPCHHISSSWKPALIAFASFPEN